MEKHGQIVAETSGQNEKMPDGVMKQKPFPCVKNQPETVEQAARQKQQEPRPGNQLDRGLDGNNEQPAHKEVDQRPQYLESMDEKDLEQNAQGGQPSDRAEQRPAPVAAQINQGKGGVGAGDGKKNI